MSQREKIKPESKPEPSLAEYLKVPQPPPRPLPKNQVVAEGRPSSVVDPHTKNKWENLLTGLLIAGLALAAGQFLRIYFPEYFPNQQQPQSIKKSPVTPDDQ